MSDFVLSNVEAINLAKSSHPISTGIGFFDHMLDQLNSHAQIGVSVSVSAANSDAPSDDKNRHASPDLQEKLMSDVGKAIGAELKNMIPSKTTNGDGTASSCSSRFCCPLDEALVECILSPASESGSGSLSFSLAPYGIFPKTGRKKIGQMMTEPLESFFSNLASAAGLNITLNKIRGENGHHIVESSFKAFSRALRNLIDGTDTTVSEDTEERMASMWGIGSQSFKEGMALKRSAKVSRQTKETSIDVQLDMDGGARGVTITTGIKTLDLFYENLAKDSGMSLFVVCEGDTWVDDHHTSEDVSIAVGKVLNTSLGTKAGLNRMWCATANVGDAVVEVTMDLSNRPCLTHNLSLD